MLTVHGSVDDSRLGAVLHKEQHGIRCCSLVDLVITWFYRCWRSKITNVFVHCSRNVQKGLACMNVLHQSIAMPLSSAASAAWQDKQQAHPFNLDQHL